MKRFLHLVLFASLFSNAFGQFNERVFFQAGGTVAADFRSFSGIPSDSRTKFNAINYNYATVILTGRVNIIEFSNNFSMSLGLQPAFSVGSFKETNADGPYCSVRIPGLLEFNFNAGATVSTRKDNGLSIGVGYQYTRLPMSEKTPLYILENPNDKDINSVNLDFFEPVVVVGYKFFGKKYYCKEINFRASYGAKDELINETSLTINDKIDRYITDFRTFSFTLSFLHYLNY